MYPSSLVGQQYDGLEAVPATVRLKDIVDALEMQFDESLSFLDCDTGQECGDDEGPDLPEWQDEEWEIAKRIVSTDRFQKLPTKFDVHQWEIMQKFFRFS